MARRVGTDLFNQPSFAAGEITPDLYGRVDQELYYIGLRTCKNFFIRKTGGASNRAGTKFVSDCKSQSQKTRLIPFSFNELQTYCLEFGHQYMRVIKDGAEVLETSIAVTGATATDPVVVTSVAHGLSNGDDVYADGIAGMTELNGRTFRVTNAAANTFELYDYNGNSIDGTGYAAYTSGGTVARVYTLVTPWGEDDLFSVDDSAMLNYAQSNDVQTVVHNDYQPRDITRTGHAAWTITEFGNTGGAFKDINGTATTVTASAVSGAGITITASAAIFDATMVGELFYIEQKPNDETKIWEVEAGIRNSDIRRAGAHYYQAPTAAATTKNISGITAAATGVITTSAAHGLSNNDVIYVSGVVGMTEINGKFFKVDVKTTTTLGLKHLDGVTAFSTSGYTAWSSGGTIEVAQATGTVRPSHIEGTEKDGDPGVSWTYLHSGFGIAEITAYTDTTHVTATVINRLPDNVLTVATPNWAKAAWSTSEGYPAAVSYHQERLIFGGTTNKPNGIWFSNTGARTNFGKSNPVLDDEAITILLGTTQLNAIRHLLPLKQLIALTSASEQIIAGTNNTIIASDPPSASVEGYTGASRVPPLIIGNTALFVQDAGNEIRTLQYQFESDSFGGLDMTARSSHLFKGKKVVDWSYQRHPLSIIWVVMDDGSLNSFTFLQEQQVYAWARHETDGTVESVCCIREGNETAAYFVLNRTIQGQTRRYVERMASRYFDTIRDAYFVDCGLSYDGRNQNGTTISISGGTTWGTPEELTIISSLPLFSATDIGNKIVFWVDDIAYRLEISTYTSTTSVKAIPNREIPEAYRNAAFEDWEFAKKRFLPLFHLEGKEIIALADGNVVSGLTVVNGSIELDTPAAVVHIGLPYECDLETLDFAQPQGQGKGKSIIVPRVELTVQESRAPKVSIDNYNNFREVKQRSPSDGYDSALPAETGTFEVYTSTSWSKAGRVVVRQSDPLPITILNIAAEVQYGS